MDNNKLVIFEGKNIRREWDEKSEKWYFSIIDIIAVLVDQPDFKRAQSYWTTLKSRLKQEGSESVTKCDKLKLQSADGKYYKTDVADMETLFRLVQSIPSPKVEPLKLWLARVGYERIEETEDPEKAIDRALQTYLKKGYSKEWINQRLKSIEIRKALTDEWEERGVKKGSEFAILTDDISFAWAGLTTKNYKKYKGLKMQSLRDNMTNIELVLNMLAEASVTAISEKEKPETFIKNRQVAKRGGGVAKVAREKLEKETGRKVVTQENYLPDNRKRLK